MAFFLISTVSSRGSSPEREIVDLVWFPTAGGKTGGIFRSCCLLDVLRRIRNPHDSGTQVLMRYTLRLLTANQFQRVAVFYVQWKSFAESTGNTRASSIFNRRLGWWRYNAQY